MVSSTGPLVSLPFAVLLSEPPKPMASDPPASYRTAHWLIRDHALTLMPSISSLRALRALARSSGASLPMAGYGNPVFKRSAIPGAQRGVKLAQAPTGQVRGFRADFRNGAIDVDALRNGLPALPETADELKAVSAAVGADQKDIKLARPRPCATSRPRSSIAVISSTLPRMVSSPAMSAA